jgi:hypothetical protein
MAEYHMAKIKRRVEKTKLSILGTDVPSSQYNAGNLNDTYLECRLQRKTLVELSLAFFIWNR